MPTDYKCTACALRFSLGPYHGNVNDGYGGARLSVCRACGTQHALRFALVDRGPQFYPLYDLRMESVPQVAEVRVAQYLRLIDKRLGLQEALAKVRTLPQTIYCAEEPHKIEAAEKKLRSFGVVTSRKENGQIPNASHGRLQRDKLLYCASPRHGESEVAWNAKELETPDPNFPDVRPSEPDFSCMVCGTPGSLSWELAEQCACPACKSGKITEEAFWLT